MIDSVAIRLGVTDGYDVAPVGLGQQHGAIIGTDPDHRRIVHDTELEGGDPAVGGYARVSNDDVDIHWLAHVGGNAVLYSADGARIVAAGVGVHSHEDGRSRLLQYSARLCRCGAAEECCCCHDKTQCGGPQCT